MTTAPRAALTREQIEALDIARSLAEAGIPLFVAPPDPDRPGEFYLPKGWQHTRPDPDVVARWRPDWALGAVMGRGLDLVDEDGRNGGDIAAVNGAMPRVLAEASTPSDGRHFFIASLGIRSLDGFLPGLDYKGGDAAGEGRGFAYIAPTVRPSKVTGEPAIYCWAYPPDIAAIGRQDDSGTALAKLIRPSRTDRAGRHASSSGEPIPQGRRNSELTRLAGVMRRAGMSERSIAAALRIENARCVPPLSDDEVRGIAASIARYAPAASPWSTTGQHQPETSVDAAELERFWNASAELQHIRDFALSRLVSPWAVLGATLARLVAAVPPTVTLPPVIGGKASLNLFVALVGPSGVGKGGAVRTAEAVLGDRIAGRFRVSTPGTGQGIAHAFGWYDKRAHELVTREPRAVLFTLDEIDQLAAHAKQQASTILPTFRQAWMGEALGFAYADPSKRVEIEAHSYRLCLIAGVQPGRASVLLDDIDGGTPQRFLWMPATHRLPEDPSPEQLPNVWLPPAKLSERNGPYEVPICNEASDEIVAAHRARIEGCGDPLDGHRLLCQEKVAFALAALHGAAVLTSPYWDLAGIVMRLSDATRAGVVAAARAQHQQREHAYVERSIRREAASEAEATRRAFAAAQRQVVAHVGRRACVGGCLRRCMTQAIAGKYRHLVNVDEVIADAAARDYLTTDDHGSYTTGTRTP